MGYKSIREEAKPLRLPPLNRVRQDESAFMTDLICAANELSSSISLCTRLEQHTELKPLHLAVLRGLMVRMYKLYDTYLLLVRSQRNEMALLLGRSACDTAIDIAYLCTRPDNAEFNDFLTSSLATDKAIYNELAKDRRAGHASHGAQAHIEASILNAFEMAGYKLDEVKPSDWMKWKKASERATVCNMEREYIFIYKNLSRLTHGSWQELVSFHLMHKQGEWFPKTAYAKPHPASVSGMSILVADAARKYIDVIAIDTEIGFRLKVLYEWFLSIARIQDEFKANE